MNCTLFINYLNRNPIKHKIIASDGKKIRESEIDKDMGGSKNAEGLKSFISQKYNVTKFR